MALFTGKRRSTKRGSKAAGGRTGAAADDSTDTSAAPPTGSPTAEPQTSRQGGKGVQDALAQLEALGASGARFTSLATDALQVILDALRLHRGALLVFDPFDQTLVLAASRGLDPQGQERLRRVRRNDGQSWDMPLHGLLSERAYLIDEPAQNRYVPALIEPGNAALARIACLPLFRQHHPVGSLVVLVGRNERFGEPEIRAAGVWLRYLATIIDDLREREGMAALGGRGREDRRAPAADETTPAYLLSEPGADRRGAADGGVSDVGGLASFAHPAARDELTALRVRAAELEASGHEVRAELDAARAGARETERIAGDLRAALEELRREGRNLGGQLGAAREHAHIHEQTIAELRATMARLEGERDLLAGDLEAARAHRLSSADAAKGLQAQLERARTETTAATHRIAELEAAVRTLETERSALVAQVDAARAREVASRHASAALQRAVERLEVERTTVSERCEGLSQQLERLEQAAADRARAAEELRTRIDAAEGAGQVAGDREQALRDELARSRTDWQGCQTQLEAELTRVRTEHGRMRDRLSTTERQLHESVANLEARVLAERAGVETAADAREREAEARRVAGEWHTRADVLQARVRELEQSAEAVAAEAAGSRAQTEAAGARARALEEQVREATAAAARASEQAAAVTRDAGQWRAEAERSAERVVELTRAVEAMQTEGARNATRADGAAGEVERLQGEAERLRERIAVLDATTSTQTGTEDALRRRIDALEAELTARSRATAELQAAVARFEAEGDAARAEAGLARAEATRATAEAVATASQVTALSLERDAQVEQVVELTATLARLQTESAGAAADEVGDSPETAARGSGGESGVPRVTRARAEKDPGDEDGEPPAAAAADERRLLIVEPNAATARALRAGLADDVEIVAPKEGVAAVARAVAAAGPAIVALNLGARGALGGVHVLQALSRTAAGSAGRRLWAYVAPPQATKGVALGLIEWMPQPESGDELVDLFGRLGARGARALSVGLDMQLLLGARKQITQQGVSLSMACDSKQAQELRDMVNPQILLVDLELPRGDGYRAIGRLVGDVKQPTTWVLCGGETPPAEAGSLVVSGAMERSAASFLILADLAKAFRRAAGVTPAGREGTAKETRSRGRERATGVPARRTVTGPR